MQTEAAIILNKWARQAIVTKYCGPTDTRGSRIIAKAEAGRMVVAWDYDLNEYANHAAAAKAFADKWGWKGEWVGGCTSDAYVFVNIIRD